MTGLRERKKAATMRAVQATALELFSARGFHQVTVEQVAEAAMVSPSTIFRYFGTKEELVLRDEFDDRILVALDEGLAGDEPLLTIGTRVMAAIEHEHFDRDRDASRQRVQLYLQHPEIRAAGGLRILKVIDEVAEMLQTRRGLPRPRAHTMATLTVWTLLSAVLNWYADESGRSLGQHLQDAVADARAAFDDDPTP